MRYVLTLLIVVLMCLPVSASQVIFEDDFNDNKLVDASYVYFTDEFVTDLWKIENGVFTTGSSSIKTDAHWQHYVDLRYYSDDFITDLTISLDYLNTRGYGGRLSIVLGQVDIHNNLLWSEDYRYVGWEEWENQEWKNIFISEDQLLNQSNGRPVNTIYIRELDITDRNGSGYIDNIKISGNIIAHSPEPTSILLFGVGLLLASNLYRRKFT